MFALIKSGFSPSCFGKIWATTFGILAKNLDVAPLPEMAKSLCPHILHPWWWFLNSPKYVPGQDYLYPSDFGQIWETNPTIGGLAKSGCPKNGNLCALPPINLPSQMMTSEYSQICDWCRLFLAQSHHTWSMLHVHSSWWKFISSCAITHEERPKCLKSQSWWKMVAMMRKVVSTRSIY